MISPQLASLVGSGISAGASVFGSLFGAKTAQDMNRENMDRQAQLNKDQKKWEAQNLPGYQKQGLLNAGYNPALMNGTSLGSVSGASVSSQSPQVANPLAGMAQPISDILKNLSEAKLNDAKVENTNANTELQKAQTSFVDAQTNNQLFVNDVLNPLFEQKEKGIIDLNDSQTQKNQAEKKVFEARYGEIMQNIENLKKEGKLTDKKCDELVVLIQKHNAELVLIAEEAKTHRTQQAYNTAAAAQQYSLAHLNSANVGLVQQQTKTNQSQRALINQQYVEQKIANANNQFDLDVKKTLGKEYYVGKQIAEDVIENGSKMISASVKASKAVKGKR